MKKSALIKMLLLMAAIPIFYMTAMAEVDPDAKITMEAKNQPLSQVLDRLSQNTGYTFTYSAEWADLNISVKVVNLDIDKTLRKILSNHNFAMLYEENGNIRIMIFDDRGETPDAQTSHDRSAGEQVHVGSAEPAVDEPVEEETIPRETATEPDSSDDPKEEPENETEGGREAPNEGEQAGDQPVERETRTLDDESPESSAQEADNASSGD